LEKYGISGPLHLWIADFLCSRTQRVRVNGNLSQSSFVKSGIPLGSVLGPVLFIIFINGLPDHIRSQGYLFLDDTKVFKIGELPTTEGNDALQQDLDTQQHWSENWLLKFHPDKCKRLRISRSTEDKRVRPVALKGREENGNAITMPFTSEKDLGLIIDNGLKFDMHINAVINKANRVMGIIRDTFQRLEADIFKLLFTTLVRPILEYGQIYGTLSKRVYQEPGKSATLGHKADKWFQSSLIQGKTI
jgi:hypothetical protein